MAESNAQSDQTNNMEAKEENAQESLKYLDFVHVAAIHALVCISSLYSFAMENAGPLKTGIQAVEGTVKAVVGPVYDRFHGVPFEILKFVDRKVGDVIEEVDQRVPSLLKEASTQAYSAAQKAPEVARSISSEVQQAGIINTVAGLAKAALDKAEPTAKTLYAKYEPVAEHYAVSAWRSLNSLPVFPQVVQIVVPTASYWTEKYNKAVCYSAEKGYGFSAYLPLVPIERIAKVFGENSGGEPAEGTTAE